MQKTRHNRVVRDLEMPQTFHIIRYFDLVTKLIWCLLLRFQSLIQIDVGVFFKFYVKMMWFFLPKWRFLKVIIIIGYCNWFVIFLVFVMNFYFNVYIHLSKRYGDKLTQIKKNLYNLMATFNKRIAHQSGKSSKNEVHLEGPTLHQNKVVVLHVQPIVLSF